MLPASIWTVQPAKEPLLMAFMMSLQVTIWRQWSCQRWYCDDTLREYEEHCLIVDKVDRKQGISLCCSRAYSVFWEGEASTQYLISIKWISRLFCCMSLAFIARGYVLAAPSTRLLSVALLALLADLASLMCICWVLFGVRLLSRSNYDCIWLSKFPPLLCIEEARQGQGRH